MTDEFKLTMAQLNACVGDFDGNLKKQGKHFI
jgi:predicted amidohydrolase